jgi:hypothetical protein
MTIKSDLIDQVFEEEIWTVEIRAAEEVLSILVIVLLCM